MLKFEALITKEVPQDDSTSHEEKMILYDAIRELKPFTVLEIGTHRGLTSLYLAHALWENGQGHLWTCDPFEWGAQGNFRKFPVLEEHITWKQVKGKDFDLAPLDFVFIDGYHEKHEVLAEIDALWPKLSSQAVVYFHDTNGANEHCDVLGAIKERNLLVEYLKTTNGLAKYHHGGDADPAPKRTRKSAAKPRRAVKKAARVAG
jgi:hypothetical protein